MQCKVQGLKVLDDCEENQKLLQKLPYWVTTHWNQYVTKALDEGEPYPNFEEFSDFVAEETRIACNPVSSLYALKHTEEKTGKEQKRVKASNLATSAKVTQRTSHTAKDSSGSGNPSAQSKKLIEYICCRQTHFIYKCGKFAAMPLDEKKKFIMSNNMCYGCLRVGHVSKNCRRRAICNICKKKKKVIHHHFMKSHLKKKSLKQHYQQKIHLPPYIVLIRTMLTTPQ